MEELRAQYTALRRDWLEPGGTAAEFETYVRDLLEQRHGRLETYRPVDMVAAARFISLSRSNPGYGRWFVEWRKVIDERKASCTTT